jgi:hypothetical protein
MNLSESDRKEVLNGFIRIFTRIYNKEYQRRVWIEGKGPECDDFDETADYILDDGRSIIVNFKDFGITDTQYLLLKTFFDEFEVFSDEHDWPADFIDTPEWTRITEMAKEVLKAFHWEMPVQDC